MLNTSDVDFVRWPKMSRDNPFVVTITEKLDGTNACIIIKDNIIVGVQSRKRFITPEDDNYGFAAFVRDNEEALLKLGDGYHFGEWVGEGIQKNPHKMEGKHFYLFNTHRWYDNPDTPLCCKVVPIVFTGEMDDNTVPTLLNILLEVRQAQGQEPKGVCVFYHTFNKYTKHTIKSPNGKWCKE